MHHYPRRYGRTSPADVAELLILMNQTLADQIVDGDANGPIKHGYQQHRPKNTWSFSPTSLISAYDMTAMKLNTNNVAAAERDANASTGTPLQNQLCGVTDKGGPATLRFSWLHQGEIDDHARLDGLDEKTLQIKIGVGFQRGLGSLF